MLDFEARGISGFEAATLTDRLQSELGNTDAVTLVERKQLEKILEEQGLQQSGCTSQECVAEVGQLLGVQLMISGSINLIGSTYTVDAKIFSVETGANLRTVSKTHMGRIDDLIPIMENIAWELVGLENKALETVAVLDFEGRGISQMEAATLTDRFTSELGNTGAVLLVARSEMNEVLREQGLDQEACSSVECAAEVGAMIGVKYIINGSVGKLGDTYTIDAQMINVATGATKKTVSKTYTGKVDGMITEIEIMAWNIVSIQPPHALTSKRQQQSSRLTLTPKRSKSRMGAMIRSAILPGSGQFYSGRPVWGLIWLGSEAAVLGLAYLSYDKFQKAELGFNENMGLYRNTPDGTLISQYKSAAQTNHSDMEDAKKQAELLVAGAAGIWVLNVLHAVLTGPTAENALADAPAGFAYDPYNDLLQVRWTIALD